MAEIAKFTARCTGKDLSAKKLVFPAFSRENKLKFYTKNSISLSAAFGHISLRFSRAL